MRTAPQPVAATPAVVPPTVPPTLDPMGVRVRRQRRRLGLTLDELAAKTVMSKPYLSLIETGRVGNPPSDEKLRRLEVALAFPPGELVSQAHLQRTPAAVRAVLAELLRATGQVPPTGAADGGGDPLAVALRALIGRAGNDVEAVAAAATPVPRSPPPPATALEAVEGFVGCPGLSDPAAFAARVAGDDMAPHFNDGDVVVFSPAAPVTSGDDCYARLTDGRTTFRRVFFEPSGDGGAGVRLQPRNERYRPEVVPADGVAGVCRAVYRFEAL